MSRRHARIPDLQPQETDTYGETREHLVTIADAWLWLDDLVAASSSPGSGAGQPASRVPIDAHVADVRTELAVWVRSLAWLLVREVIVGGTHGSATAWPSRGYRRRSTRASSHGTLPSSGWATSCTTATSSCA